MIAGTGILRNNQMNNFSHEGAAAALRNGTPPPRNAMVPGKRMLSTMMPTLVFNPDTVRMLAAMGLPITSDETMGSAQSIVIENGLFLRGADPRRPGALVVAP